MQSKQTLSDALAITTTSREPRCKIARLFRDLDKADADSLRTALADLSVSGPMIMRAMNMLGHTLSYDAVKNHRRGLCSCERR